MTLSITPPSDVAVVDIDLFCAAVRADPHPVWAKLRDAGPVVWIPKYGHYLFARHAEVQEAQKAWETFTTSAGAGMSDIRLPGHWRKPGPIVEKDPPEHTAVRKVVHEILNPLVVRGWRQRFESEAERIVAEATHALEAGIADAEAFGLRIERDAAGAVAAIWQRL